MKKGKLFYAFSQVPFEKLGDDTVIVSSHVDFLKETKECFSDTSGENEIIGTYDNSATNAVITELMIHEKLSENTLVVFTGDEEEESGGAEEVAEFTEHLGIDAKCIVLDVTEEGYNNASFTIENAYCSDAMLEKVIKWMVGQDEDYFFVPAEEWQKTCKPVKEMIPKEFVSPNCSEADESGDYSNEDIDSISFCLPTKLMDPKGIYAPKNSGAMHSSKGLMIKKEAVRRYTAALCNLIRTCFAPEDYKNREM